MTDTVVWPARPQVDIGQWTVHDIEPGDLVFCSKEPGADFIERLNEIAGQQWRHVASVFERDGVLCVAEIDKNSFGFRPLAEFMAAFDRYGAARLRLDPDCIVAANALMEARIEAEHFYAWDDLILAGMLSLTTRGIFVRHRARVRAALASAADAAKRAQTADRVDSFTCSGFIEWAYGQAPGKCRIEHDRWLRAAAWPPRLASLDALLAPPGEALPDPAHSVDPALFEEYSLLELVELTEVVDLQGDWRPNEDQYGEMARVLWAAVGGFLFGEAPAGPMRTDGRWVTPTDLWESRSVAARGMVTKPTA